jgi:acyl carrier protein
MNRSELSTSLTTIFSTVLDDPSIVLGPSMQMGSVDSWDSFNQINLMLAIESHFSVEFESDEIGELTSVAAILDALALRLGVTDGV